MGKLLVVVLIESVLRFCKRLVEHNRFLVVNNCILTMATTWLCVQGYGDKKGGASQDGVKTDKGKIFTVSWDGRVDSHRSSLSLREFAPPERGYVASFCGRPIGVDSAVQKQATRRVEF